MNPADNDFDADDDFDGTDHDGDSVESHIWQLLLLINPGDEETALEQFAQYRDAVDPTDEDGVAAVAVVRNVIDWRSGFQVDAQDTHALVQAVEELSSRWNIAIDWGSDTDDDDFHADIDAASLFASAYDRLAEHGYTLWACETDDDRYAGWVTLTRDNEPLREVAAALGINMRLGSEVT